MGHTGTSAPAVSWKPGHPTLTPRDCTVRIGTWNLAGRWDARHLDSIEAMDCDVLLLTEVSSRLELPGYHLHMGRPLMAPKRRWAAIASRLRRLQNQIPMAPRPWLSWRVYGSVPRSCRGAHAAPVTLGWVSPVQRRPARPWPRRKPVLPRSGAEIGTTPCQAGNEPAQSRAEIPCSRRLNGWISKCPQTHRLTR